jgi:hypothetical protein
MGLSVPFPFLKFSDVLAEPVEPERGRPALRLPVAFRFPIRKRGNVFVGFLLEKALSLMSTAYSDASWVDSERMKICKLLHPFGNIRCFSFVKRMYLDNF